MKHRQPDEALQQLVDSLREEARIPGCVLLVDDGSGQPPLGIESGYSDPANGRAATLGEYYPIGSVTKTFVAALTMRAWQAGLLDLDEPLGLHLPELEELLPIAGEVPVRLLLNHRSGLPNYSLLLEGLPRIVDEKLLSCRWREPEILALLEKAEPLYAPGAGWNYCNTNYLLLGMLLERVHSRDLATLLSEEISGPLGLADTVYMATQDVPGPLAVPHLSAREGYRAIPELHAPTLWRGAGAIVSTAADLLHYSHALFGGDLLGHQLTAAMQDWEDVELSRGPDVGLYNISELAFGLGLLRYVKNDGLEFIGHHGGIVGYRAELLWLPRARMHIVALGNRHKSDLGRIVYAVARHMLGMPQPPRGAG
ncbi:beta-lactamase family protein [bacterium]|nr:beta-lactamase family protein [bacterium]